MTIVILLAVLLALVLMLLALREGYAQAKYDLPLQHAKAQAQGKRAGEAVPEAEPAKLPSPDGEKGRTV